VAKQFASCQMYPRAVNSRSLRAASVAPPTMMAKAPSTPGVSFASKKCHSPKTMTILARFLKMVTIGTLRNLRAMNPDSSMEANARSTGSQRRASLESNGSNSTTPAARHARTSTTAIKFCKATSSTSASVLYVAASALLASTIEIEHDEYASRLAHDPTDAPPSDDADDPDALLPEPAALPPDSPISGTVTDSELVLFCRWIGASMTT